MPYGKILVDQLESSTGKMLNTGQVTSELNSIARSLNVADTAVIYSTDTVTLLDNVLYIYGTGDQVTWGVPDGVGAGEVIVSVSSDGVLTTNVTTYKLITTNKSDLKMTLSEAVSSADIKLGDSIRITDRAGGVFDVVLTSSVTTNTFDIVQCTTNTELSLMLKPMKNGQYNVESVGAVADGDSGSPTDNAAALNRAFDVGMCYSEPNKTYYFASTVRMKRSFKGAEQVIFKKGAGALLVHYPARLVYTDYIIDANGEQTAADAYYDNSATFAGGVKYSFMGNVACRNMTLRAFNFNQPLFGFTGINLRVAANNSDGSADNVTAFYTTIEDSEGIGSVTTATNASFSLITPNVYNRSTVANDVTFIQADYCRGVSITGAEVAAARIIKGIQFDGSIQGAFEYINTHSTLFNSTLMIGGGTNIQTFRNGVSEWTGDTDIPSTGSAGRHIFRVDADTYLDIPNISLFNQIGTSSGTPGGVGLVACAAGFSGKADVGQIHKYDLGGGGFLNHIQVSQEDGNLSKHTNIGKFSSEVLFYRDVLSADSIVLLYPQKRSTLKKYVRSDTSLREFIVEIDGETLIQDVDVRVTTYDSAGVVVGATKVVLTVPSGSSAGYQSVSLEPNRYVPDGGYYEVSIRPDSGSIGSDTTFMVTARENY